VGRFISRDAALSEHPYLYCGHEPVNAVDPSGHVPKPIRVLVAALELVFKYIYGPTPLPPPPPISGSPPPGYPPEPPPGIEPPRGSGGGLGAIGTIIAGLDVLAEGLKVIVPYRKKVASYYDPEGDWIE